MEKFILILGKFRSQDVRPAAELKSWQASKPWDLENNPPPSTDAQIARGRPMYQFNSFRFIVSVETGWGSTADSRSGTRLHLPHGMGRKDGKALNSAKAQAPEGTHMVWNLVF